MTNPLAVLLGREVSASDASSLSRWGFGWRDGDHKMVDCGSPPPAPAIIMQFSPAVKYNCVAMAAVLEQPENKVDCQEATSHARAQNRQPGAVVAALDARRKAA